MDFYSIIKKIDELEKALEQTAFPAIEKDILKTRIAEMYLLLFEKQEVVPAKQEIVLEIQEIIPEKQEFVPEKQEIVPPPTIEPPIQKEPVVEEKRQPLPFNVDYKSLVDAFLEKEPAKQPFPEDQSLLSKIAQTKIIDLKRSIAMNDRFIFIKELFKNDFDAYNRYINDLNGCETMQQTEPYLAQLKQQYGWDMENETVQYFLTIVGRKFD